MLGDDSDLILPAIALAESLWIVDKLGADIGPKEVLAAIESDPRIRVAPLTREIVERAHGLRKISEMHDRQIVATALAESTENDPAVLLTRDEEIVASGLVKTAW